MVIYTWLSIAAAIVVAAVVCVVLAKKQSRHTFQCRRCGQIFQPRWTELVFAMHALGEHKLMCPHCHEKGFCKDQGRVEAV